MLEELFKRFVKEKTFLANVSPKTVRFYQQSYKAFKRTVGKYTAVAKSASSAQDEL